MRRRDFITLLGGAVATWPHVVARAQQAGGMRQIGWLIGGAENDDAVSATRRALQDGLATLGWIEGRNLQINLRFGAGDVARIQGYAAELVSLAPDVIIAGAGAPRLAVQQLTRTIPILFVGGADPVVAGIVRNIARPEGNVTGFSGPEPAIAGKWLELLKEAAPHLTRVAIIFIPELTARVTPAYISVIETAAPTLATKPINMPVRNSVDIVRAIDTFAAEPNGGLLYLPPPPSTAIRETILQLAAERRLPTVFPSQADVVAGALIAYQRDLVDDHRRAATYVDRLLRGAKVSDLPVQFPNKFQFIVNLKTAKAIGLTIPQTLLLRADEVIE